MASIAKPAVSPKLYRHFAVVTVVCTLLLAIFADGEKREAIAQEIQDQKAQVEAENRAKNNVRSELKISPAQDNSGELNAFYARGTRVMEPADGASSFNTAATEEGEYVEPVWLMFGLSQSQWEALSEEKRKQLLDTLKKGQDGKDPIQATRAAIAKADFDQLLADSQERAGKTKAE